MAGIKEACEFLNYPVVSGNVSFYNETQNKSIKPTPTIGGVGLIKNIEKMISMNLKEENSILLVIGKTLGHLYQSEFFKEILNFTEGPPPSTNLFNEKNNGLTVLKLINEGLIESCHDIYLGGIIVAVSKMCINGKKGIKFNKIKVVFLIKSFLEDCFF